MHGFWYYWVKIKADPSTAATYQGISIVQNPTSGIEMTFKGPIHPIDLSVDDTSEQSKCGNVDY